MQTQQIKFHIGQIMRHKNFGYRGVIYDVDALYSGTEVWYQRVAKSRPAKDQPWYHVLVDGSDITTYVAESNMLVADDLEAINHPLTEVYFINFSNGKYILPLKQ